MNILSTPKWIAPFNFGFKKYGDIPQEVFDRINNDLDKVLSGNPKVSILISAWNEEVNILRCIAALAKMQTKIPFEIIVINNNSTDHTQDVLDRLHVRNVFQGIQGWGPARQIGQENAKGEYILLADADCFYPPTWVDAMIDVLKKPGIVCIYGRYSFIPEPGFPRWKLFLLEKMKDVIAEVRQIKRPYLNAYGINMGYVKEYGLKIGFVMKMIRGDEGRLAFDMMSYGKIKQVRSDKARTWTGPRTLEKDGSFGKALSSRILREIKRFGSMFTAKEPHDTKTSTND
ncbi:glycosyltransferase family 2 protein [Arcticibacter tournemirensis]